MATWTARLRWPCLGPIGPISPAAHPSRPRSLPSRLRFSTTTTPPTLSHLIHPLNHLPLSRLTDPSLDFAIITSSSTDPFVNLSIEQYLLDKSGPKSRILFQYINRPCVVIGRNQNPWVESDLRHLRWRSNNHPLDRREDNSLGRVESAAQALRYHLQPGTTSTLPSRHSTSQSPPTKPTVADLVRRRSGGGTVFHDGGNVNWSTIVPAPEFDRDKHALVVAAVLRRLGVSSAAVNSRHDVVVDDPVSSQPHSESPLKTTETAETAATAETPTCKVSGSAYRITRRRALHHATCLLSSPNLHNLSHFLAPGSALARTGIEANGVASVRSRVCNVGINPGMFVDAVASAFYHRYLSASDDSECSEHDRNDNGSESGSGRGRAESRNVAVGVVGDEMLDIPDVRAGYDELTSVEWKFLQTPAFKVSLPFRTNNADADTDAETNGTLVVEARHGLITRFDIVAGNRGAGLDGDVAAVLRDGLVRTRIDTVADWHGHVVGIVKSQDRSPVDPAAPELVRLARVLTEIFPPCPDR